jgi:hypothetical protein
MISFPSYALVAVAPLRSIRAVSAVAREAALRHQLLLAYVVGRPPIQP